MNYGKLAYGALSDLSKRMGLIEKRENYQYGSIGTCFAFPAASDAFLSGNLAFRAECDTSLYVSITAEIRDAAEQNVNVTVLLDETVLFSQEKTVAGGRLSAEANAAEITKGNHSIRVKLTFATASRVTVYMTVYGSGIRENTQQIRASFDTRVLLARKGHGSFEVTDEYGDLKLTLPCEGCYEISFIGGDLICFYTDTNKNLYASVYDGETLRFISSRFLSANVTSCAAVRCTGAFDGICAYVRSGKVFFRMISRAAFGRETPAKFSLGSVAEVNFIRNADLPVLLTTLQSGRCAAFLYQDMPNDGGCIDIAICAKNKAI